jgi:hypothetical protein
MNHKYRSSVTMENAAAAWSGVPCRSFSKPNKDTSNSPQTKGRALRKTIMPGIWTRPGFHVEARNEFRFPTGEKKLKFGGFLAGHLVQAP